MAGVSGMNTDSTCRPSASSSTSLRVPSVETLVAADAGRGDRELVLKPRPQLPRQVGHLADVVYPAPVDPAVDLAGVERLFAPRHAAPPRSRPGRARPGRSGFWIAAPRSRVISSLWSSKSLSYQYFAANFHGAYERRCLWPADRSRERSMTAPSIVREVLPNGLRLLTERMPHVRSVSIGVWLARGSRHESLEQSGIAHFVEHMLFKGTATRSAEDIAQTIDSIGGQMDAFTSKEYAGYYLKVLDEHVPLAVDVLSDIVMRPAFADDGHRAREEGGPRRDQDGRGHARRSGPRDLLGAPLGEPSARPADSRHARQRQRPRRRTCCAAISPAPTSRRI